MNIIFENLFLIISCISFSYSDFLYETKYLDVPLDHFSFADNRTFALRYLINDSYWEPDHGPMFFYTGNEGDIEMFAQNTGFMWNTAPVFHALLLFAEHRYYGLSMPFGKDSLSKPEYFGYLSSEQALADFVDVIYHVKQNMTHKRNKIKHEKRSSPVIAFGGSYGGMLAAWMRMKYPAVIEGALASSAPIWQFTGMINCFSYNQILTAAFNSSSPTCVENIKKSWDIIFKFTHSEFNGKKWLTEHWKLCEPLKTDDNVSSLIDWISEVYSSLAMINYPYPTNFLMPVPANPVKEFCSYLDTSFLNGTTLLEHLFQGISVYFNFTGTATCLNWSKDSSSGLGVDGWSIQSCNEMVMPMCSNGITDMFKPSAWDFTEYSENCYRTYNIRPQLHMVEKQYGGKNIQWASNIIFSNGSLDPWLSGGVTYSVSPNVIIFILPGAAHHLDLRTANKNDPPSVVKARKQYMHIFRHWIQEYRKRRNLPISNYDKYLNNLFNKQKI